MQSHLRISVLFFLLLNKNTKGFLETAPSRNTRQEMAETGAESDTITILGFGSLLSERSSRMTFPNLSNFRLVRVPNYRRVFSHPASIFFQRKIADMKTLKMSSLSVEPCKGYSFVASAFEVPKENMMENGVPSLAFLEREEEFDIVQVQYSDGIEQTSKMRTGTICQRSTDDEYLKR